MADFDLNVKIILLGDFSVDKGKLLRALRTVKAEPEVAFLKMGTGMAEVLFVRNGKRVRAKIIDTAGQERFRSITSSFYRGTHGCLLLFDITKKETFENLNNWLEELKRHTVADDTVVTLVGCNSHVEASQRQVSRKQAEEFAVYLGIPYEEVNVKAVGTLARTLGGVVDRIILMASRAPVLNNSIKPLEQKLEERQQGQGSHRHCAC